MSMSIFMLSYRLDTMNKYNRWYNNITSRAKSKPSTVVEKHHILPKSLGGSNDPTNLAWLTPREHYICHLLLVKIYTGKAQQKNVVGIASNAFIKFEKEMLPGWRRGRTFNRYL